MRYFLVTVRDRASDVFGVPSFVASVGSAIRGFGDEVNREARDNAFYMHPDDFDLYVLGEYDDAKAAFSVHAPKMIAVGKDLKIVRSNGGSRAS